MLSDISLDGFLCLLEYLYTDYCTLTDIDITMETLILADRLCLPRLVQLCEELIGKILDINCYHHKHLNLTLTLI